MEYMPMSQKGISFSSLDFKHESELIYSSEVTDEEKEQRDREELMLVRAEYEKYKELWGLNLQYSHSAGAAKNYSRLDV